MRVGVVGCGVVGGAIVSALKKSPKYKVVMHDKYKKGKEYRPLEELVDCKVIFVSVPTPFDEEKNQVNLSAVKEVTESLHNFNFTGILIIKSTVPPSTCRQLQSSFPDLTLIFNPEFLRARTAVEDFYNQTNIIMGTSDTCTPKTKEIIEELFSNIINNFIEEKKEIVYTNYELAELVKYSQNVMLASRVTICNIIYDACQELNIDYDSLKELAFYRQSLIGDKIVEVPGPDGLRGFGGMCLPKDTAGFNSFNENDVIKAILEYNKLLGRVIE